MMKKWQRTLAALLACTMLALAMTACGSPASSEASEPASTGGSSSEAQTEPVDNTFVQNEDGSFISGGIKVPLEEPVTYTFWTTPDASTMDLTGGDMYNNTFWAEFTRRTNVHFEFITPAVGTEREQYNLVITSGELPDVMSDPSYFQDGLDAAVEDEYFMDLTDLIPVYMPDYVAAVEASGQGKELVTDSGVTAALGMVFKKPQAPIAGFMIRKDWLDEQGLPVPETYDEMEAALRVFRDEYGCESPMVFTKLMYRNLGPGMGYYAGAQNAMYQVDGTVYDTYLENPDGAKEYLSLLNRWYEEGLIDQNFMSNTNIFPEASVLNTETAGCMVQMYSTVGTALMPLQEAGGELAGVPALVKNKGDEVHYNPGAVPSHVNRGVTISADCENVEILLAAFNYLYTKPGDMLHNYGIEGEQYTLDENGNYIWSEEMLKNIAEGLRKHTLPPSWAPSWVDADRQNVAMPEVALAMQETWTSDNSYMMPSVTLTAEEAGEYADISADLNTFLEENELQFITGAKSIEDEWDSFLATYESMGAARCVELYQAALDRYNAR